MTAVADWRTLFPEAEAALFELLLDNEQDAWQIYDLIGAAGLTEPQTDADNHLRHLVRILPACFEFIDDVLRRHPHVVPPECLRPGRYPWIRQRRDVHQFDVGSHLACCCALAIRGVGRATASVVPAPSVAAALDTDRSRAVGQELPMAAVFHDLFKCFRPRRALPAKLGPKYVINWAPPGWEMTEEELAANEVTVAGQLLPEILGSTPLLEQSLLTMARAEEISWLVTRMRSRSPEDAAHEAAAFWATHPADAYLTGLALYLADVASKGFVRGVPILRKGAQWSLEQVSVMLVQTLETMVTEDQA